MHDDAVPSYLKLRPGELSDRARVAVSSLEACRVCPRDCKVDRLQDRWSVCRTGRNARVTAHFPHMGEEDCLRGWKGSGTIFFGHCNLRCVFCQNFSISQDPRPHDRSMESSAAELAATMIELQNAGCHNINLVTPEHVVPQILEALALAVDQGLRLPIVYNTSAYDSIESLQWLDGVVDIYMPDLKLWHTESCRRYLKAADYPQTATAAVREMHRQVGSLQINEQGLAFRGVLIRHLVMPGLTEETGAILRWIAHDLGEDSYVNLMDQYRPAGKVSSSNFPELNRRPDSEELARAERTARNLGLRLDARDRLFRHRPRQP